jgi:hypothetical protein
MQLTIFDAILVGNVVFYKIYFPQILCILQQSQIGHQLFLLCSTNFFL